MKIIGVNATYRPEGTTTRLTRKALEGAASCGAATEMILLREYDIQQCRNCLTCYKDLDSEIGACVIRDDVRSILEKIRDADGIILASPVHCSFVTGLMMCFMERATWTLCRPTGELMGLKGTPQPRLLGKARASATIVSAGAVPIEFRRYCDLGTPWMKEMAEMLFNGELICDMYAAAVLTRQLDDNEWSRAYLFRDLTEEQMQEAFDLGKKVAEALEKGAVRPYDPARYVASLSTEL